jgi:transposase-like protein
MARGSNAAKRLAWQERLQRFVSGSPVSVTEFCRQEQVSVPSFYAWRKKLTQHNGARQTHGTTLVNASAAKPARAQAFVPLRVTASASAAEKLEIRLPNGAQLCFPSRLGAAGWLASVVAAAGLAAPVDGHERSLAEARPC